MENQVFEDLFNVNVNGHTEEKNGLTYLSWAWAIAEVMKKYPDMQYSIERFGLVSILLQVLKYLILILLKR